MPQIEANTGWEKEYAVGHQLPQATVYSLCSRMRSEPLPMASYGTAANWAHKRKVKLNANTSALAEEYFQMIVNPAAAAPDEAGSED